MPKPYLSAITKASVLVASLGLLSGCVSDGTTASLNRDERELTAAPTAHPELQSFLDEWHKEGVTIAESTTDSASLLVAFTDDNGNGVRDGLEPLLAQVPGEMSDVPQLASTELASGAISGRCFTNSYEVRPGEYFYRGQSFVVTWGGISFRPNDSCTLSLEISSEAFPGEQWAGLLKGTKRGEPLENGWVTWPSKTNVIIEIPWPTGDEVLEDAYGRDGELAVASEPEGDRPWSYPEDRMIVGSWTSEVTFSN
jgi:hypothetical protein